MTLIGLSGKKGVGKNFVADQLVRYATLSGSKAEMAAFADPLKEFCINVLGLPREACYGSDLDKNVLTQYSWTQMPIHVLEKNPTKKGQMSIREVMQVFGTEFIRTCWDKDAWVNAMTRRIKASKANIFIITDVRFPNESHCISSNGGMVWMVTGPSRGDITLSKDKHESETAMDEMEVTSYIENGVYDGPDEVLSKIHGLLTP